VLPVLSFTASVFLFPFGTVPAPALLTDAEGQKPESSNHKALSKCGYHTGSDRRQKCGDFSFHFCALLK